MAAPALVAATADPPKDLARRAALRETENEAARQNYMYRQIVTVDELTPHGAMMGRYEEVRDVVFTAGGKRDEEVARGPFNSLKRIIMTEEDFHDIREVQPFLFTKDVLWLYETKPRGAEEIDGHPCYVLEVRPRQILQGQRLFEGLFWIRQEDFAVIRMEGKAVPEIRNHKTENLFVRFTTIRQQVDGKHWFPVTTYGDDVLGYRGGAQRLRMRIEYSNYRKFQADSTVTFQDQLPEPEK